MNSSAPDLPPPPPVPPVAAASTPAADGEKRRKPSRLSSDADEVRGLHTLVFVPFFVTLLCAGAIVVFVSVFLRLRSPAL